MTLAQFAAAAALIAAAAPEFVGSAACCRPRRWSRRVSSPTASISGTTPPRCSSGIGYRGSKSVPLVLAIAFLAATMSHLLIERPLQGFRRNLKLAPSAAGIMDADATPAAASSR